MNIQQLAWRDKGAGYFNRSFFLAKFVEEFTCLVDMPAEGRAVSAAQVGRG